MNLLQIILMLIFPGQAYHKVPVMTDRSKGWHSAGVCRSTRQLR